MDKTRTAFVTDFDGTITDDDFFQYVTDAFLDEDALEPWRLYLAGRLTHFEALRRIYGSLRAGEDEMAALLATVRVDADVVPTFELLRGAGVTVVIASAGCDFYINALLGNEIRRLGIGLVTNPSRYSRKNGLVMERLPEASPFRDEDVGISKAQVVAGLRDDGFRVVFAGDGPPDIEPARIADAVFARGRLLDLCAAEGIATERFGGYADIRGYFEGIPAK